MRHRLIIRLAALVMLAWVATTLDRPTSVLAAEIAPSNVPPPQGTHFLSEIVVIFALAVGVIIVCQRLKIPSIVGFLLTGAVAGPHALAFTTNTETVSQLADLGVALLLFTIGIEFSLKSLMKLRVPALIGGPLQVVLTAVPFMVMGLLMGQSLGTSILVGAALAQSSTAIVLKLLHRSAEVDAPHGQAFLGIAIFQDLSAVPLMLALPLLAGTSTGSSLETIAWFVIDTVGVLVMLYVAARWIVPGVLFQVAQLRDSELFLVCIVAIALGVALLTAAVGLSLALGAFLAGMVIAQSGYSQRALSSILPLRDLFTSLFFVSVGMLFKASFVADHAVLLIALAGVVIGVKFVVGTVACLCLRLPLRPCVMTGVALAQVGEFAFVMLAGALQAGMLSEFDYQMLLGISILTMMATPFVLMAAPKVADWLMQRRLPDWLRQGVFTLQHQALQTGMLHDHIIVVGFGVNGQNLSRAAKLAEIPYVILEMNPMTVHRERANGLPIMYGDASQDAILEAAHIHQARVVVIAISDAAATRRVVDTARRLNPKVYLIARTRFLNEVQPLYDLGADEVIPEEFETSIEIFTRVLRRYLVPQDEINKFVAEIRGDGYRMLRKLSSETNPAHDLRLAMRDVEISTFRVGPTSLMAGKTLMDSGLRKTYGVSVLAVRREQRLTSNPGGDFQLQGNDMVIAVGSPERLADVASLFVDATPTPESPRKYKQPGELTRRFTKHTRILSPNELP